MTKKKAIEAASGIDPQHDVRQFMAIAGQAIPERPQWPDQETMDLRVRLESEEFTERMEALGYGINLFVNRVDIPNISQSIFRAVVPAQIVKRNLPASADGAIDLIYVLIGSLLAMGIDMWPLWAEVQRANMAWSMGSCWKPEGWQPPDIEGLLRKQGWEGQDGR